jgi:hypothetical protein
MYIPGGKMATNNVIPFKARQVKKSNNLEIEKKTKKSDLIDITSRRQDIITQERREAKRTVLTQFVGAFVVLPKRGLQKVELYDISPKGVSFDLPFEVGQLNVDEEVAMRFYINHTTFFPFDIKITNARHIPDEGIHRHGSGFIFEESNREALKHFVSFIEAVSVNLREDKGDIIFGRKK